MTTAQVAWHEVTKRYDDRTVFDRVSLTVKPGEKAGVIGDNGSGKSTLLKLLAGEIAPDNGEVTVVAPDGVGHLAQTLALPPEATVRDAVDLAMAGLREIEAGLRRAEVAMERAGALAAGRARDAALRAALAEYGTLVERYEARGGYEAEARVDIALHGLGLPGLARDRRLGTLSGGERSRLALAATLASGPELLLLDEPTNDLDDQAVGWLEERLRAHRGTVLVVTHDRLFLERLTTTVLEVGEGRVTRYGDGYAGYRVAKAAERRARLRAHAEWRAELDRNRNLVDANSTRLAGIPRKLPMAAFGHNAFRARGRSHGATVRIRNAKERVERLVGNPVAPPPEPLRFTAEPVTAGANPVPVELAGVRVGQRLDVPALSLPPGGRLLVTGPNGAGKSTLLRVLAGEERADAGTVQAPSRVGHLRQEETPWPPGLTVPQAFAYGRPGHPDEQAAELLSLGLFDAAELRLRVGELSYGQRRRIELARLVTEPVDLLLLDEPTNHLAPALVEELEAALTGYAGTLVVVTHDRGTRAALTASGAAHLTLRDGRVADFRAATA